MAFTIRFQDGDLEFGTAGEQVLIQNAEKAAQDLLHEILLPYEPDVDRGNEMFQADGSLVSVVNSDYIGESFVRTSIQSATKRCMVSQTSTAMTTPQEKIRGIRSLIVQPLGDQTAYGFFLAVEVDDQNIALARAIRLRQLGVPAGMVGGYEFENP